jgi:hypothetical protein
LKNPDALKDLREKKFQDAWNHFGQFWNFILPRNIIKVINFQFCPQKIPDAQTISGNLGICMLPNNYHPPFQVLSHMKESMVTRITLEALVKMRQYLASLFHPKLVRKL